MSFRHIVLVRFKPEVTAAERVQYAEAIAALNRGTGRPFAASDNVGSGPNHYDYAAVTDFADEAAFRAYLASPEHRAYVENFGKPMVAQLAVVQQII
jgi:quinol monooxygenase YgiN